MLVTVVTVVKNAEKVILKTMESVLNQTYKKIEYVLIDGLSKDKTPIIINNFIETNRLKLNIKFICEKDSGIYDAMNKGIKHASGDFIYFLNAGDTFFSNDTIEDVFNNVRNNPDIICGNVMYIYKDRHELIDNYRNRNINRLSLACGIPTCHQALFVSRVSYLEHNFDLNYRIRADQEFLAYSINKQKIISYVDIIIANYDTTGISSGSDKKEPRIECDKMNEKYNKLLYYSLAVPRKISRIINK